MPKRVLDTFYSNTGICFLEKRDIVTVKIENFCKIRGFDNINQFVEEINKEGPLWQELINFLTVNETYFFREHRQLDLLMEFAKEKNSFDILCLPCSTGEEVYTIIMMLEMHGLIGKLNKIVGVDINSEVVEKAKAGKYDTKSFHKMKSEIKDRFFTTEDGLFCINEQIKQKATFVNANIFEQKIFELGTFDFLLSRNMLIYFDKHSREKAGETLVKILKDDGVLFLGHADIIGQNDNIVRYLSNGVVYYRKK